MLLNVAFFMAPHRRPPDPDGPVPPDVRSGQRLDRGSATVQRLLALSFTATFALTAVTVAMDLVGWQCAAQRTGAEVCGTSWLGWLAWSGLDRPGRQLAVTALGPLAVIGLLWWLARTTWRNLESAEVGQLPPGETPDVRTPLEDRALWNGRAAVRRLRALHVGTGLVVPGVFAVAPLPGLGAVRTVLLAVQLAALALIAVTVALPTTGRRERPVPARRRPDRDLYAWLPWAALGLTVLALVAAAAVDDAREGGHGQAGARHIDCGGPVGAVGAFRLAAAPEVDRQRVRPGLVDDVRREAPDERRVTCPVGGAQVVVLGGHEDGVHIGVAERERLARRDLDPRTRHA
jgi:hypothetical protein